MTHIEIFYSWQSDLPNKYNRGFIKDCLEKAIKSLDNSIISADIKFRVDKDTEGTFGAPDIAQTIFEKIDKCHIFIGDISIINSTAKDEFRKVPNPNVLVELGYAAAKIGWGNVILMNNTAYGNIEEQPFDIRARKQCAYNLSEENKDIKSTVKKRLIRVFTDAFYNIGTKSRQFKNDRIVKQYIELSNDFTLMKVKSNYLLAQVCKGLNIEYSDWDYLEMKTVEKQELINNINSQINSPDYGESRAMNEERGYFNFDNRYGEAYEIIEIEIKMILSRLLIQKEIFNYDIRLSLIELFNKFNETRFFTVNEELGIAGSKLYYVYLNFDVFDYILVTISNLKEQFANDYVEEGIEYSRRLQDACK